MNPPRGPRSGSMTLDATTVCATLVLMLASACGAPGGHAHPLAPVPPETPAPPVVPTRWEVPEASDITERPFLVSAELRVSADGTGDYASLSEAVAAAAAGTRILIAGGRYEGNLLLDKPLILEAEGSRPSLHGTSVGTSDSTGQGTDQGTTQATLRIENAHVILRNLVVHAPAGGAALQADAGTLDVDSCVFVGGQGDGLLLQGAGVDARLMRAAVTSSEGLGIRLSDGARLALMQTEFSRNGVGLSVEGGVLRSRDTRFASNGTGLAVSGAGECSLAGGFLWSNSVAGVWLEDGAEPQLRGVTIRSPGGLPGIHASGGSAGLFEGCTVSGTPMEADHHTGGMTRDHIATELRDGTDHHILTGLVFIEQESTPTFRDCTIENALGHGLLILAAAPRFEDSRIVGSVFYNIFMTDAAQPHFLRTSVLDAGENGIFSWLGSEGVFDDCTINGNGSYTEDRNRWAQVVLADGATTRFLKCRIEQGGGAAVVSSGFETRGDFLGCSISGHGGVGVSVSAGGNPSVESCTIADNGGHGVWITRGGAGVFRATDITGNKGLGLLVDQSADTSLMGCLLAANEQGGVLVRRQSHADLVDCRIQDNLGHGLQLDFEGRAQLDRGRIRGNTGIGVLLLAPSHARLQGTAVESNGGTQISVEEGASLEQAGQLEPSATAPASP